MPSTCNRVAGSLKLTSYSLALLLAVGSVLLGCRENPIVDEDEVCSLPPAGVGAPAEPEADFVWRLCNTSEVYPMDSLVLRLWEIKEPIDVSLTALPTCTCSAYLSTSQPLRSIEYVQGGRRIGFPYLATAVAQRGLTDPGVWVRNAPGRYTYHFAYRDSLQWKPYFEVEREAYHSQD